MKTKNTPNTRQITDMSDQEIARWMALISGYNLIEDNMPAVESNSERKSVISYSTNHLAEYVNSSWESFEDNKNL